MPGLNLENKYRISPFTHFYKGDEALCLYHSLGISPIFFPMSNEPFIQWLTGTLFIREEFVDHLRMGQDDSEKMFELLLSKKFIVLDTHDSQAELESFRSKQMIWGVSVMYLLLTDKCNLSCRYCFVRNSFPSTYRPALMSESTVDAAIQFFARQVTLASHSEC
ncbi:MAG TPA: hypothetical protein VMX18_03545 [Candidatus Bipolaricaulota bacterium]|nr:hypothetical protein [Candidatus Bipolaricaulota bacterium]